MVTDFPRFFPKLLPGQYRITSPFDGDYNCIAWAAGDTTMWWWPFRQTGAFYWPNGVAKEVTLAAFQAAFATIGYAVDTTDAIEAGVEKIAIFADSNGIPTHAARQLANGWWTSKMGAGEDIEHALRDLEGDLYGTVAVIMRRLRPLAQGATHSA